MQTLTDMLIKQTSLSATVVANILTLLESGATVPFIARYRKEMTEGASDEALRDFEKIVESAKHLLERKADVARLISERSVLDSALKHRLDAAQTLSEVEDIFRPFKEKKNSRAQSAMEKGLEPLADVLEKGDEALFYEKAKTYVGEKVASVEEAVLGAQDILAERYADAPREREAVRTLMLKHGVLEAKKTKTFDEKGAFVSVAEAREKVALIPSHRYLALMRGAKEKQLSVKMVVDVARIEANIYQYKLPKNAKSSLLFEAYKDGLKRLLLPSLEREVHGLLKARADTAAIDVFGKNLHQLLMSPPVQQRVILGVDPAFRTGCKLAVIDAEGTYLAHEVIYPTPPHNDTQGATAKVVALAKRYGITAVAIGNGTASRETQEFFATLNAKGEVVLPYTVVSEAGASVYSASKIASEEYPQLDVSIRGAISIAQRLRDPMAALVKIDPKALGIGQYQHDVDQKQLEKKLQDVTQDLVNRVGVDANSASVSLLGYVAGIGPKVAKAMVAHRETHGRFTCKADLLKVKGLGAKAYEQAAGFVRIKEGKSPLDNTGVHPESYPLALALLKNPDASHGELMTTFGAGEATLKDIVAELQKPGFDPREALPPLPFKEGVTDIGMLEEGSVVSGVVRNIVDFGVFVDIGLKNDGMIHLSRLSLKRVGHPLEVVSLNQYLPSIRVIGIDLARGKVSLSLVEETY